MTDDLDSVVHAIQADLEAADWATKTFCSGVPEHLLPSRLMSAALAIQPDVVFAKANNIYTLTAIYGDNMSAQSKSQYALLQDGWAGEGAQTFGYLWDEVDARLTKLAERGTAHGDKGNEVGTTLNNLRQVCAELALSCIKGMHDIMQEYLDAVQTTFSDLWNGVAGNPTKLASALTDASVAFISGILEAAGWQVDINSWAIAQITAFDAIPAINTAEIGKLPALDTANLSDFSDDWRPEEVDGKPWDSS